MTEALWSDVASSYDRSFSHLCAGVGPTLLARLPEPVDVLDVGCGTGRLSALLVSGGHRVLARDPEPTMARLTRQRASVSTLVAGLPDLPLRAGTVDAAVASFVLNHVADPWAAARGLERVLRPGGRVLATVWPAHPPPLATLWQQVLEGAGAGHPPALRLPEGRDFERSAAGLVSLIESAGLEPVDATAPVWDWRVRPEDLWAGLTTVGGFGHTWRAQRAAVRTEMRAVFESAHEPWLDGDMLVFGYQCVLVEAVRPRFVTGSARA